MEEQLKAKTGDTVKILQGSFLEGCGITVKKVMTGKYYHLLVHKEKKTGKLFVEIGEQKYYENEVIICRQ